MRLAQALLPALILAPVLLAQAPQGDRPGDGSGRDGLRGGPPRPLQRALDIDADGTLSALEIAAAPTSLRTLDKNGDGTLTPDELQPRREGGEGGPRREGGPGGPRPGGGASPDGETVPTPDELTTQLMSFDKNGDGVLTPDEVPARMQSLFARADTDHDGKLTRAELRALAVKSAPPPAAPEHGPGEGFRDPLMTALDTDHDGKLSSAEIAASPTSLLTMDTNHDGSLSPDEMRPRPPAGRGMEEGDRRPAPSSSDSAIPQPN